MSNEPKTCPMMSRPIAWSGISEYAAPVCNETYIPHLKLCKVPCLGDECNAWGMKIVKHPNRPEGEWIEGCKLIPD